jgi:tetratricopeptide (TPR) repeat protein
VLALINFLGIDRAMRLSFMPFGLLAFLWVIPAIPAEATASIHKNSVLSREIAQNTDDFEQLFDDCYNLNGEAALLACDRALELAPNDEVLWTNRGAVLQQDFRQYEDALASYARAIAIKPDYSLALYNHCNVLSRLERYPEAMRSCDRALNGDGRWGDVHPAFAWDTKGLIFAELGQYDASLNAHNRAVELDPTDPISWYNRGIALTDLNRYAEAIESFDRALAIDPNYEAARRNREILQRRLNP